MSHLLLPHLITKHADVPQCQPPAPDTQPKQLKRSKNHCWVREKRGLCLAPACTYPIWSGHEQAITCLLPQHWVLMSASREHPPLPGLDQRSWTTTLLDLY